jgi:hypothetical protein
LNTSTSFEIDADRLEADYRREEARRSGSPAWWRVRRWATMTMFAGTTFVVIIPLIDGERTAAFDPNGFRLWVRIVGAVIVSAVMMLLGDRREREVHDAISDPAAALARARGELQKFHGPGWIGRTVRMGAYMALAIGVPIGALLALFDPQSTLDPQSHMTLLGRFGVFTLFVVMTFAWAIPVAFFLRWLSLSAMKKYLVRR